MSIELVEVQEQEIQQMRADMTPLVEKARAFVVTDEATCLEADKIGAECKRRETLAAEKLEKSRATTWAAFKAVSELIKELTEPFAAARKILDGKVYMWRKEEKRRREAQAAKEREDERKRVEDERLKQAEKVSEAGRPDLADKILSEKIVVSAPEPEKVAATVGTVFKENWQGKVVDEALLPREFLTPDLVKLGKVTKAMKGDTKIPGWEVWDAGTVARSSK